MRQAFLLVLLCMCGLGLKAQKQAPSAIISEQKIYLKYQGNNYIDSLQIPVVSNEYPSLKQAIEKQLFDGREVYEIVENYQRNGHGITSVWYKVTYQSSRIISLVIYYETLGPHPDGFEKWLTYDIHTGKPYLLNSEINNAGLNSLFAQYKQFIKKGIAATNNDMSHDTSMSKADIAGAMLTLNRKLEKLTPDTLFSKYVFTPEGIILTSSDALSHALRNYDLVRDWLIPYCKLRPYRKPTAIVVK